MNTTDRLKQRVTVIDDNGTTRQYDSIAEMVFAESLSSNDLQCLYYRKRKSNGETEFKGRKFIWGEKMTRHYIAKKDGVEIHASSQNELSTKLSKLEGRYISQGNLSRIFTTNPEYKLTNVAGWIVTEN